MDASQSRQHLKSVIKALPEPSARVAENVMLRCEGTLITEPKTGVVAMSATGVKAVQVYGPIAPRTLNLNAVLGGY